MEPIRKKSIDGLVNKLKSKYDTNSLNGLKQLAKDREIYVIESEEIPTSLAIYLVKNRQGYILLDKNSLFKYFHLGHEIGHHLLYHLNGNKVFDDEEETEANYFSEQLLNKQKPSFLYHQAEVLIRLIKKPGVLFKDIFFPSLTEKKCLELIKNYEQQNGKI